MYRLCDVITKLTKREMTIRETCAECTIMCDDLTEVIDIGALIAFAKELPASDHFVFQVEFFDEDLGSVSLDGSSEDESVPTLLSTIKETVEVGYSYSINFSIRKGLTVLNDECVYRVYDLGQFEQYFFDLDFSAQVLLFSDYCQKISVPRLHIIAPYDNAEIVFGVASRQSRREELIRKRKSICDIQGEELYVTPDDLHILSHNGVGSLMLSRLRALELAVSLMYLASSSYLDGRSVGLNLRGVAEVFNSNCVVGQEYFRSICELFTWMYEGGDVFDKREIAHSVAVSRNRLSPLLELDQSAVNAIRSSYVFYLRENIADYLRNRDSLTRSITEQCEKISGGVIAYVSDLKGAYLVLLGNLLSMALLKPQTGADPGIENDLPICLVPWIILLLVTAVGVFLYVLECRRSVYLKTQLTFLKAENSDLLYPGEVERFFGANGRVEASEEYFGFWSKVLLAGWVLSCVMVGVAMAIFQIV